LTASFIQDTLRSLRTWRRTPGSALLVILGIGLSGGALLVLVSLFNALFWRELPISHPGELVGVSGIDSRLPPDGFANPVIPATLFVSLDRAQTIFQAFAGYEPAEATAVIDNTSQQLAIDGVTGRYFDALGVRPLLGQLVEAHDVDTAAPVATISFHCWQSRFGADPHVIGQPFRLRGEIVTVVGVAPQSFTGLEAGVPTDAWVPAPLARRLLDEPPNLTFLTAFGRLRPGSTLQQARAQIESLWPQARQAAVAAVPASMPETRHGVLALQPRVDSAARGFSASGYRFFYRRTLILLILCCATTIVLACANLSGLLLARWSTRETDLAVRATLGASNGRLVSQVVGESLALSMIAVVLSAPLALWSAKGLTLLLWNQPDASSPLDLTPDYRVIGVMVVLGSLVALSVSLLPAARIWSAKLTLTGGTRGLPGRSSTRSGRRLAAAQVALSVPLLVTTWMVAVNLHRLEAVNTGFQVDGVVIGSLAHQSSIAPTVDAVAYLTRLVSALDVNSGIQGAALSSNEPMSFGAHGRRATITGDDGVHQARPFVVPVSPGFFDVLSMPLLAGRDFTWADDSHHQDVVIISNELARLLFPGANPVGRRVRLVGSSNRLLNVIGVVPDAKLAEPHATNQLFLFTAFLQEHPRTLALLTPYLLLKSALGSHVVGAGARRTIVGLGRDDLVNVHPLLHTRDAALLRERLMRLGAFYFAGLTTLLVFVGLYAVLNLGVVRRIPEIGLRLAIGASTPDIRNMVIREALVTAVAGLSVGIPCAFACGQLLAGSLTLVESHDAFAFTATITLILAISALAVLIPLRRATRVTPLQALGSQ
jgi:predicted permease